MNETKIPKQTQKQKIIEAINKGYTEVKTVSEIADDILKIRKGWLTQKQTIPKILCNQLCHRACKVCLLDDALSKTKLLEDLEK